MFQQKSFRTPACALLNCRIFIVILFLFTAFYLGGCEEAAATKEQKGDTTIKEIKDPGAIAASNALAPVLLDTIAYNQKLIQLANGDLSGRWPAKAVLPLPGAILPFRRIVAFYGNLYSKQMGILGEYAPDSMLSKLKVEVKKWEAADSTTPVQPALHYIAVTAQGSPGAGGKYRLRMPASQIDKVLDMAKKGNAIVFLDIQVGLSNLKEEIPALEQYLKMPQVHLGIDPEFSMKTGKKPGTVVGTFDAGDINYASEFLSKIVRENNLPPKILIIHRFTQPMVTNYKQIKTRPEVQIIMDMDGWGESERKIGTYKRFVAGEPVQFTGFKLFYKNDTKKVKRQQIMQPAQILKLKPQPIYIQYQ